MTADNLRLHITCVLYYTVAGDRESARVAYKKAEEKTAGSGPKMDLVFSVLKYDVSVHTH